MTVTANAGDWVQIERVVLEAGQRAPGVPPDTQATPLMMRVKGFALESKSVGEEIAIRTMVGREICGRLVAIRPGYDHGFGQPIHELVCVGAEARTMLRTLGPGEEQ